MGCRNRPSSYKAGKHNSVSKSKMSLCELARSLVFVISQQTSGSCKWKPFLICSPLGPCVCDGVRAHVLPLRTHAGNGGDADWLVVCSIRGSGRALTALREGLTCCNALTSHRLHYWAKDIPVFVRGEISGFSLGGCWMLWGQSSAQSWGFFLLPELLALCNNSSFSSSPSDLLTGSQGERNDWEYSVFIN